MQKIVTIIAAMILVGGCMPKNFVVRAIPGDQTLRETTVGGDESLWLRDKIAVIDVDGLIAYQTGGGLMGGSGNPVSTFIEKLRMAEKDKHTRAVVLRINSPGGSVAATDAMYEALTRFKKDANKPVIVSVLGMAASGGYYLACGGDAIIAQPGSVIGSIGTIMQTVSVEGTLEKIGVRTVAIKSGELKDIASITHNLTDAERQVLQEIIDAFYGQFCQVVRDRRDLTAEQLEPLADGRIFTAKAAVDSGLVDALGYLDDAVETAKHAAGIEQAKIVMYQRPTDDKTGIYAATDVPVPQGALATALKQMVGGQTPQAGFYYLWNMP